MILRDLSSIELKRLDRCKLKREKKTKRGKDRQPKLKEALKTQVYNNLYEKGYMEKFISKTFILKSSYQKVYMKKFIWESLNHNVYIKMFILRLIKIY